jgi:hypothetical protein
MKIHKTLFGLLLFGGTFLGCKEDDTLTEAEKAKILLVKPWEVAYVQLNTIDVTDLGYLLMQIEFYENGTWQSSNANGLFEQTGSWALGEVQNATDALVLILSGKETNIRLNPEGSTLTMNFTREGNESIGGRLKQSKGDYQIYWLPKFIPATQ